MKKALTYILITLVFLIIGFYTGKHFFNLSLLELNQDNIQLINFRVAGQFKQVLTFMITVGLLPLLFFISKIIVKIKSYKQDAFILSTILFTGLIFWQLRIVYLNGIHKSISNNFDSIPLTIPIENLKFAHFLGLGFIIGTFISVFAFKFKQKINQSKY